jgi:hypothetical protein
MTAWVLGAGRGLLLLALAVGPDRHVTLVGAPDVADHPGAHQRRPPHAGPEGGAAERTVDLVGEHRRGRGSGPVLDVLADQAQRPRRQRDLTAAGGGLRERLERAVSGDLHHGADHPQRPGVEVQGVVHQPGDLTPPRPAPAAVAISAR